MTDPKILNSLYVTQVNSKEYGVFTNAPIYSDSTIEYCAWLPVTQKLQILIENNDAVLSARLFNNPDGLEKEREILAKITDLELQNRLDRGLITPEQFRAMIMEIASPNKFLHVVSHAILLGYGSLYRRSLTPNINWEYNSETKLYRFFTVQDIQANQELTYFSN